jgi:hypothetical protein
VTFERILDGPDDSTGVTVEFHPDPCLRGPDRPRSSPEVGERLPDESFDRGRGRGREVNGAGLTRKKALQRRHDERGVPHESEELPDVRVRVDVVEEQQCIEIAEDRAQLCWSKMDRQFRAEEGTDHLLTDVLPQHSACRD